MAHGVDLTPKPIETAVILAAGLGSRLRSVFDTAPKGLLPIGGRALMTRSLDQLIAAGIRRIVVVIGHRADDYRKFLEARRPAVEWVENPDYAASGSMHSLWCARGKVTEDFLLLESDLIYEPRALRGLIAQPARDCLLLSGTTGQGDEVYAIASAAGGDRLRLLTKSPCGEDRPAGEFVGITRISRELMAAMCHHYESQGQRPSPMHYDDCLSDLSRVRAIHLHKIDDLVWGEVDDAHQLERVRAAVLPALG